MRKSTKSTLAATILTALSLCIIPAAYAQQTATPAPNTQSHIPGGRQHHPEIHKALHALERAKSDLQLATHDYGGHRVQAIQAIDQALDQLHQALQYAKTNPN